MAVVSVLHAHDHWVSATTTIGIPCGRACDGRDGKDDGRDDGRDDDGDVILSRKLKVKFES